MKKLSLAVIFAMLTVTIFAQDNAGTTKQNDEMKTLFGKGNKVKIGWFVGPNGGYTSFGSNDIALAGLTVGMIINHNFTIGLTGFGAANSDYLKFRNYIDSTDARLEAGYGGLLLEYTLFPRSTVHVTFPVMIGGGNLSYYPVGEDNNWSNGNKDHRKAIDQDAFFVVEPGVRAEVNILKFMRFGVGVSYRYTPDLDMLKTSSDFINNFTANASLKFGKF
jgi:hypothetical protein